MRRKSAVDPWRCAAAACALWSAANARAAEVGVVDAALRGGVDGAIHQPSAAFDRYGNPGIAYLHPLEQALKYAWSDDGGRSWGTAVVDDRCAVDLNASLALDSHDNPRIAYTLSAEEGYAGCLRYASSDDGGRTWRVEKLADAAQYPVSLVIDREDNPCLVFMESLDGGPLVCLRSEDGGRGWSRGVVDGGRGGGPVGLAASLALDGAGRFHAAYFAHPFRDCNELRYAYSEDPPSWWDVRTLETDGDPVTQTSIAVDSSGGRYVAYSCAYLPENPELPAPEIVFCAHAPAGAEAWDTDLIAEVNDEGAPGIRLLNDTPIIAFQSMRLGGAGGFIGIARPFEGEWIAERVLDRSPFQPVPFEPCWIAPAASPEESRLGIAFADKAGVLDEIYRPLLAYLSCKLPPDVAVALDSEFEDGEGYFSFGRVYLGCSSEPMTFTVRNAGKSGLIGRGLDASAPEFAIEDPPARKLQPGDETAFSVRFAPSRLGPCAATVTIETNDPDEPEFTFTVHGVGIPPPPAP